MQSNCVRRRPPNRLSASAGPCRRSNGVSVCNEVVIGVGCAGWNHNAAAAIAAATNDGGDARRLGRAAVGAGCCLGRRLGVAITQQRRSVLVAAVLPACSATDDEKLPDWVDLSVRRTPTDRRSILVRSRPSQRASDTAGDCRLARGRCAAAAIAADNTALRRSVMVLVRRQRSTFSAAFSSLRVISLRKILFDLSAIIGIRTWHRYPPRAEG